ncbi:MAG: ribose 5-phosphate isomerase B [Thermaerobacter sp.]|nr:ribose 5-phosphate isomerase B [Thermaerobacter sp.]
MREAEARTGWLYLQTVGIGSDHAGLILKREVLAALRQEGIPARDYGTDSAESCDYPDFAQAVGHAVASGEVGAGVLICGTGIGMSIAANKILGVRAALAGEGLAAELARRHNDANILCLGSRLTGPELAREAALRFLRSSFEGGRHARRVAKISAMDLDNR